MPREQKRYRTVVIDPPWPYKDGPLPSFDPKRRLSRFLPYQTMTLTTIEMLPIGALCAPAAHVYLWSTNRYLWDAKRIAEAWGVKVTQVLTWAKAPMGLGPGSAFANTTEFILFGRARVGWIIREARERAGLGRGDLHRALFDTDPTGIVYRWEADDCFPTADQWNRLRCVLHGMDWVEDITPEPNRHQTSWFEWPRGAHSQKPEAFIDLVEQVSPGPYVELFARRHRLGWDVWGNESANTARLKVVS